jgi:hypothetical protein
VRVWFVALKFAATVRLAVMLTVHCVPATEVQPDQLTNVAFVPAPGSRMTTPVAAASTQFAGLFVAQLMVDAADPAAVVTTPTAFGPDIFA